MSAPPARALDQDRAIELAAQFARKQIARLDGCSSMVEDAVQEACVKVWLYFQKHKWATPAMVSVVAFRAVVDYVRSVRGRQGAGDRKIKLPEHLSEEHTSRMTYHDRTMQRAQFRDEIARAKHRMPPRCRQTFKMFCQGHSQSAIARILKRSPVSVRQDLHHARRVCREVSA